VLLALLFALLYLPQLLLRHACSRFPEWHRLLVLSSYNKSRSEGVLVLYWRCLADVVCKRQGSAGCRPCCFPFSGGRNCPMFEGGVCLGWFGLVGWLLQQQGGRQAMYQGMLGVLVWRLGFHMYCYCC
jgi:hypothetical protein